ncbi:MAG: helix-turn-helix domain-containing protein [Lachnospiraceae bacterium]|nr:helix-turn-helix domain-containing protein [Lachnospiraceae bacterium]
MEVFLEDTRSVGRFAQRLKTLRRERGIIQRQLADGVGISKGGLSYYENSGRTPDISILERFADYFVVTAEYISSSDEGISSTIQNAMIDVLYENTKERE